MGLILVVRRTYEYLNNTAFRLHCFYLQHLEYANSVWSPHLKEHIVAIENVQGRASKWLPAVANKAYEKPLKD